jgi:DNA-binding response OmpR family regulator
VAEDDAFIRRVVEVALRRSGLEVRSVVDGVDLLEAVETAVPDLVIVDGMMPRLDGIETCRRLKADPRFAHLPVIVLSARSHELDEKAAREAGAIGYIVKPFNANTLAARVREICEALPG